MFSVNTDTGLSSVWADVCEILCILVCHHNFPSLCQVRGCVGTVAELSNDDNDEVKNEENDNTNNSLKTADD